eukprot:s201_g2.t1
MPTHQAPKMRFLMEGSGARIPAQLPEPWPRVLSQGYGLSQNGYGLDKTTDQVPSRFAVFASPASPLEDDAVEAHKVAGIASMSLSFLSIDDGKESRRHFFGHTRPIEVLEGSDDGHWLASVQGATVAGVPVLRLWRTNGRGLDCTTTQPLSALCSVQSVAFDGGSRFLAVAGQDSRERPNLLVFDMSRAKGGAINLIAQQFGPDVTCVRFSPFEELNLVSCGMENIRFWRVKEKHIPGCLVPLGVLGRQTQFTCLGFECRKRGHSFFLGETAAKLRVFVSTSDGRLLQVGYQSRKVLSVHQLHSEAITWICANDVFVVTAGCDHFVRVWPVDFHSFYLHSKHESAVVGIDITADGRKVLCSNADGSIGVLDVRSHQYKDISRSHKAAILQAAVSERFQEVATAASDGSIKVWKIPHWEEVHEFLVDDQPQTLVFHPQSHLLAVSFQSGAVRIFNVETQAQLREVQLGRSPVLALQFIGADELQGEQLVICDASGTVAVFDQAFNLLRSFQCPGSSSKPSLNAEPQRLLWPAGSRSAVLLNLLDGRSVAMISAPEGSKVSTSSFSWHGRYAVLGGENKRIHVFEAEGGSHVFSCAWCSSPACDLLLVEAADGEPCQPWMLLVASVDRLVRTSRLYITSTEVGLEQTFAAHATASQQLLLCRGAGGTARCVSVSSSELACWELSPRMAHFFEQKPPVLEVEELPSATMTLAAEEEAVSFLEKLGAAPEPTMEAPQTLDTVVSNLEEASAMVEALAQEASHTGAADSEAADLSPAEKASAGEQLWSLELAGFHGCSLRTSQSFACDMPLRLCYILGSDVCLEEHASATGPSRKMLSMPRDDEGERWQAIAVEMEGQRLAAVFACSSAKQMRLCSWTTAAWASPETIELTDYGDFAGCFLRLSSQLAITAPVGPGLGREFRVDLWRFSDGRLWASSVLPAEPLDLKVLEGKEFGVLTSDGLTLWRFDDECDADTAAGCEDLDASCARLQFQVAEPPAGWDLPQHGSFVAMATGAGPELEEEDRKQQLAFLVTAGGMLWVHDVDDNVGISLLQVPKATTGVTAVSCSFPLLVLGVAASLHAVKMDLAGAMTTVGEMKLDGHIRSLRLLHEQRGVVATAANTIWYFDVAEGSVVPLQGFHQAPGATHLVCSAWGNFSEGQVLCSSSGAELRLWREEEVLLEVARVRLEEAPCAALHFLPDGLLACALVDGTVLFFDLQMFGLVSRAEVPLQKGCAERCPEKLTAMEVLVNPSDLQLLYGTSKGRILRGKLHGFNKVCRMDVDSAPFSTFVAEDVAAMGGYEKGGVTCSIFALGAEGEIGIWSRDSKRLRSAVRSTWCHLQLQGPPGSVACFVSCTTLAVAAGSKLVMYSCQDGSICHEVETQWPVLGMAVARSSNGPGKALLCAGAEGVAALVIDGQNLRWLEEMALPGGSLQDPSRAAPPRVCASAKGSQHLWVQTEVALSAWKLGMLRGM